MFLLCIVSLWDSVPHSHLFWHTGKGTKMLMTIYFITAGARDVIWFYNQSQNRAPSASSGQATFRFENRVFKGPERSRGDCVVV
jgi:hypothetical protein